MLPVFINPGSAVAQGFIKGVAGELISELGAYSQNSNIGHHLIAKLTVSPSEHLILDSQQNLRQTLTLVTCILQN